MFQNFWLSFAVVILPPIAAGVLFFLGFKIIAALVLILWISFLLYALSGI
jgi:hypothetical protein